MGAGKGFLDFKAEPAVADRDAFTKKTHADSSPSKGAQVGLREGVSPSRDRMADALR